MFLDADDYWDATNVLSTLDKILCECRNLDVLRSVSWSNAPHDAVPKYGKTILDFTNRHVCTGKEYLCSRQFFYDIWTSCYRRQFLIENSLYFRERVAFEDSDWPVKVFWSAKSVMLISFSFYVHRLNPESTAMKPNAKVFCDNIIALSAIDDFIKQRRRCLWSAKGRVMRESKCRYCRIYAFRGISQLA